MLRPDAQDLSTRPINAAVAGRTHDEPAQLPRSSNVPEGRPAKIMPDTETASGWSPYGTFQPRPYFGGHDELSDAGHGMMWRAESGMYDPTANAWPNNGQYDRPNGFFAQLLRLMPHTSAHPGKTQPVTYGPVMLFHAPPVFSVQTQPIPAVGV